LSDCYFGAMTLSVVHPEGVLSVHKFLLEQSLKISPSAAFEGTAQLMVSGDQGKLSVLVNVGCRIFIQSKTTKGFKS